MPILLEKDGILKCIFCNTQAEYRCAACGSAICEYHSRYGRIYGYNISKKNEYYCIGCWRVERNNIQKTKVSKISLISGLKKIGITTGDNILTQSSISCFGSIDQGPETIIDALQLSIGDSGTILMPAFTFSQNNFHFRATKVDAACGILPELLRRRAKSTRSNNHPLSFVATGKNAVFFINNAIKYETLDELSPIKRLIDKNGKLLMLGVEFNNCLPVIYADIIFSKNRQQSCGKKYYIVEDIAKNLQSYKELIIGEALCRVMNVGELVEAIIINLTQKPNLFNCYNNNCRKCMSHIKINRALFDNNKCKEL